ncbi:MULTISPECIES: cytidine deaminase [Caloramator]|uniref:Cytidine deaminase n=1 Tax=Caloramator proteoclasticus DSM 10124 TaxID=1121262 RepID=A0A1M4WWR2_9CLOT|nr:MULTISPECIES: cytidine deaminase [Caloramator]SHE85684.1 cytidine deaminase [Caloramator proteoclasticus DSM 10124]
MEYKNLVEIAKQAMEKAYVPHSKFRVGAALLTSDGKVFTGCNIENATFGATNCAERTAIFKAVSEGYKNFEKIAIISDSSNYTYPCGICRQVIIEFSRDIEVICSNKNGEYKVYKITELLPFAFTSDDIERSNLNE